MSSKLPAPTLTGMAGALQNGTPNAPCVTALFTLGLISTIFLSQLVTSRNTLCYGETPLLLASYICYSIALAASATNVLIIVCDLVYFGCHRIVSPHLIYVWLLTALATWCWILHTILDNHGFATSGSAQCRHDRSSSHAAMFTASMASAIAVGTACNVRSYLTSRSVRGPTQSSSSSVSL